ncbi:t-complex protein1, epsilon-SU (nucleomorph) [Cryptomonas paramecium]|uniref:T-complex protein1, epsilon-SU n=1 Tax=Cryptomonas paramaecium TaxID=2898 RepID=F2HI25_9CRYP|nr:t-complex protein1, epsilon-SU [Cryptomonas paramecium]AEA38971.1 t-complex protein1, epsilon-SU [Cryptomonas paramecium]
MELNSVKNRFSKKKKDLFGHNKGFWVIKKNISFITKISNILKSSFGPLGMDKIINEKNGNIIITNDGATILSSMDVKNSVEKMLVNLSKSQDEEIGDGTTGIIIMTASLLKQAEKLIEKGIHPVRIVEGFEYACDICLGHLENISERMSKDYDVYTFMLEAGITSMNSKITKRSKKKLSELCIKSVFAVCDVIRKDVNLDLIKFEKRAGGHLEHTMLINGIIIDKEFSHTQMPKQMNDVRLCILTCPLEPPKPKTKYKIEIKNEIQFNQLYSFEQKYFHDAIFQIKSSGANLLLCQWGFDDEGNHLLLRNKLSAVRWVSGTEIELLAVTTGAQIVPRFNEITSITLGYASKIRESSLDKQNRILIIENCAKSKVITVLIRGSSEFIVEEIKRSLRDGICVIRNLIKDNRIVFGGGSVELSCSLKIYEQAYQSFGLKHCILNSFSESLRAIPMILAENAGYSPIETLYQIMNRQIGEKNFHLGIDCTGKVVGNMKKKKVFETLLGKQQQIQNAVQLACAILKIDDLIKLENDK